jgi:phenacrylate decarboxylase
MPPGQDTPASSLRAFLEKSREDGDVVDINVEVDPHLESAAITRRAYETGSPMPLMNNLKGKDGPNGLFRILGCPVGVRHDREFRYARFAQSIGLPTNASGHDIIRKLIEAKKAKPMPAIRVESAPLKEHKIFGDDIDLSKLPVPLNHERDGGRYFLTYGLHSVQTPDGKWLNWAITRCMLIGKRRLTGLVDLKQDIGVIWDMWKAQGKDTPWACALGIPPAAVSTNLQE